MAKVEVVMPQEAFKCNSVAEDTLEPSLSSIVSKNVKFAKQHHKGKNKKCALKNSNYRKNSCASSKTFKNAPMVKKHSGKLSSKKRNKNRRRRKWKPYSKLSWSERRELEERNSRRANRIREEMSASGLPLAPYNTTQFLMDDHQTEEPDYSTFPVGTRHRDNSNSLGSSDEFYSCPEDEEEFLQKQFVQAYDDIKSERLQTIDKNELVEEYIRLEDQVEELEKTLVEARLHKEPERTTVRPSGFNVTAELEKIRVFREEIEKLTLENDILERQNEILQMRLLRKT